MTTRKSNVVADVLNNLARRDLGVPSPRALTRAAGRARGGRLVGREDGWAEALEPRVMLDGDHPAFPNPFNPSVGTALTIDIASPLTNPQRGRALTGANQGVAGTISGGDTGDTFRFTMPSTPGRDSDFVTVLADTILAPDGTPLNSTLDTFVEVYNSSGTLIASGANNGILSSSATPVPDGWVGFVGQAGAQYTIRVRSQPGTLAPGRTDTGNYTLRVDTVTLPYNINNMPAADDPPAPAEEVFGEGNEFGTIGFRQDEVVYRVTSPTGLEYDSLATAGAIAGDPAQLDTHLDIYDSGNSAGVVSTLASDLQAGRLTNAWAKWRAEPGATYYVRVRSDELASGRPVAGDFRLSIDLSAFDIPIDPVTRLAAPPRGDVVRPMLDLVNPPPGPNSPGGTISRLFQFTAQGTGVSFVTVVPSGQAPPGNMPSRVPPPGLAYPPLEDPAVHLYDDAGNEIAFNDDANGFTPQLEVALVGGRRYFVVVEGFDRAVDGGFNLFIQAHYTNLSTDEHVDDTPTAVLNFQNATPIRFGNTFMPRDADGNADFDAGWYRAGVHRGRIYTAGDTDLFQFVPPVSSKTSYDGNDGNEGQALYVGGNFGSADRLNAANPATNGRAAPNVAIWDGGDWFNAGPGDELMGLSNDALFGAPSAINGAVLAYTQWDPDGEGTDFGVSLVAAGQFTLDDGVTPIAAAVRVLSPITGSFVWQPLDIGWFPGEIGRALTTFDFDGDGDLPPSLVVGGTLAGGVVAIAADGSFATVDGALPPLTQANAQVFALATYDPPQPADPPDPDGAGPAPDPEQPPDPPVQLVMGGLFTENNVAGNGTSPSVANARNIVSFGLLDPDGDPLADSEYIALGGGRVGAGAVPTVGPNGAVFSLLEFDQPGQNPGMPPTDIPNQIIAGGSFTQIATFNPITQAAANVNANNIAAYNNIEASWAAYAGGRATSVRALTTWEFPGFSERFVVAGGGTAGASGFVALEFGNAWIDLTAADDIVRALTVFEDDEFDTSSQSEVLYFGGDFTMLDGAEFNGVAKFDDQNDDGGPTLLPLKGGIADLAPGEMGNPGVYALSAFDDDLEGVWDRNERPSSRVSITVAPTADSFLNAFITIYDSNFNIVYQNETINPIGQDPAGAINPATTAGPGTPDPWIAPGLWAGEVYYIAVSGAGTGRYTLSVSVEAFPVEATVDGDGVFIDDKNTWTEVPNEGQWAIAPELDANGSGDGSNFDLLTTNGRVAFQRINTQITPGGDRHTWTNNFAVIEDIEDTDLYQFRAPATGFMEIRISTFNIQNVWDETVRTMHTPLIDGVNNDSPSSPLIFQFQDMNVDPENRTFNSPLDALLKVFNNDFELLGANDDSLAVPGFGLSYAFAANGRTNSFVQRDPRLVIPVVAGETYFIQVESAFRSTFMLDPDLVDWRHATGAYDLEINSTPSANGIDDYENANGTLNNQTAVPIDLATGDGALTGFIDDVPAGAFINPNDTDMFRLVTVNRGLARITIDATSPNLIPVIRIFDVTQTLVAQGTAPAAGGEITLNVSATQGAIFFIVIDGDAGTEGSYELRVDSVGLTDDHVKDGDWANATPISLNSFLGTYTLNGDIENPADWDTFAFTAAQTEIATVTITRTDPTLNPTVFVYEINADAENPMTRNPAFLLVGANSVVGGAVATANFSVTEGRRYFVVVTGTDQDMDFGRYGVTVSVAPTDDHPNRGDFPLATQVDLSGSFDPLTLTSTASIDGNIEVNTDDDMFRFTAPATGRATVTVTTPASGLSGSVFVYSSNNVLIGSAAAVNGTATFTFDVSQNVQYYVQVIDGATGAGQPDDTGTYTLTISTQPVDDYPDAGDFANPAVGVITLSPTTGVGSRNGVIVPSTDSDLFRFDTLASGNVTIRVTTVGSALNPLFRVFDASFVEIPGVTSNGDTATLTFPATAAAQRFYVLVIPNTGATGTAAVGNYAVQVIGTLPGGPGPQPTPDDHADAGEFGDATLIPLNSRTGFGSLTGIVETAGDTDLFKYVPTATGRSGILVKTPAGGLVDGRIRVFNQSFVQIGEDASGILGATAAFNFTATAGQTYFVLVEPVGVATGSYSVEVSSQPITHFLYYPEGFAGSTIDEFVPIVNPNDFAVTFSIFARYEVGASPTDPIATGTVPANSRGGVTISTKSGASLVDRGRPYALEIQSSGQLGATLSHYDFNVSVGEAFTNQVSTTWTFAQVNKNANTFRDFVVFYNPSGVDAELTMELFYGDGTVTTITQSLGALRRGGINVNNDSRISKVGRFGMRITSTVGIVAAVSSYNLANSGGDGLLGNAAGGSTAGVIPNVSTGGGVTSSISFLNTNATPATITVTASYARVDLPDLVRVITVQPNRQMTMSLSSLGLISGQQAGIRYASNLPITASVIQYQNGDGDTTPAAIEAARELVFGDLFVNPASAGITYIENLGVYNPSGTAIDVDVTFLFTDGTTSTTTINVGALDFAFVKVDQQTAILSRGTPTAFSLIVSSQTPIVASLSHYDLFLNGGWSTLGATIGLTTSLASV